MAKRQFQLSEEQVNELQRAYAQCKDGPTRTRYQAVRLYGSGYAVRQVQEITGCSRPSLMEWCRAYRQHGPAGLVDKRVGGNHAKLRAGQVEDLKQRLHQYTPREVFGSQAATSSGQFWTVADLRRAVEQWYGVRYQSPTSYLHLLHLCAFSYQRPNKVFTSRRPNQLAEFEEQLEKN